jgi:hypothetical protein
MKPAHSIEEGPLRAQADMATAGGSQNLLFEGAGDFSRFFKCLLRK